MDRLTAMRVFVDVAELGSLAAAADKLDMSRAMVTRYVAELEKWLGARLMHRSTRSLGLTAAGLNALPRCRHLLALSEDVQEVTRSPNAAPSGPIRVTTSISLGYAYLATACNRYLARYPGTTVELLMGDQAMNLVEQRIDLAIRITDKPDNNLIARKLTVCRSVACATPTYLAKHGTPFKPHDLIQHNCLRPTRLGNVWHFTLRGSARSALQAIPVNGSLAADDATVLLQATLGHAGISRLPTYAAAPHIQSGALVYLLSDYDMDELGVFAMYASRRHLPATTRTLVDFLAEELGSEPPWDAFLRPLMV